MLMMFEDEVVDMDQPPVTYAPVGCTRTGVVPDGFDELRRSRRVGSGRADFGRAADALMTWQMHRRAGIAVMASHARVETGAVANLCLGVGRLGLRAPVRVVDVVDEPTRRGFAYGTLPGHPESGEESFVVELGETGDVTLTITVHVDDRAGRPYDADVVHEHLERAVQRGCLFDDRFAVIGL
jgi:uncharacterized protein (UPF0548 family)